MSSKEKPTIVRIVRKKKHDEHGSHGAWKVAFADFMTAMMCLFLVLWITSMDQQTKSTIEGYFKDPTGKSEMLAGGMGPLGAQPTAGIRINPLAAMREAEKARFETAKDNIEEAFERTPEFAAMQEYVEISITTEGLKIELVDAEESFFFEPGRATLKPKASRMLSIIASELGKLNNRIVMEGHTDASPYRSGAVYTNWELSADRANAARRVMSQTGLKQNQVFEVRGYGASKLRKADNPNHFSNRRVSILAKYTEIEDQPWHARGRVESPAPATVEKDMEQKVREDIQQKIESLKKN